MFRSKNVVKLEIESGIMVKRNIWDVVVVGGGPTGSSAAKRCAEHGLKTLLLEKQSLPRHKVCTGALMCSQAQNIVKEVFGDPPREVLTTPPYVKGFIVYSPGYEGRISEHRMHLAWRDDLDYWMDQKAVKAGAELWQKARAVKIGEETAGCKIELEKNGQTEEITAKFVIGADGGNSVVRRSIFPEFKPVYMKAFQHVYKARLNLDPEYIHWYVLFPDRYMFEVHQKTWRGQQVTVLDGQGRPGETVKMQAVMKRAVDVMAKECGFDPKSELLWKDGCLDGMWLRELFSGAFLPAKGNVLIAGDASGIRMPITADGIGTGVQCGVMAADAINKAIHGQGKAADLYLSEVKGFVSKLEKLMPPRGYMAEQGKKGPDYLLDAYKNVYDATLKF